jgi:hypothetical protein
MLIIHLTHNEGRGGKLQIYLDLESIACFTIKDKRGPGRPERVQAGVVELPHCITQASLANTRFSAFMGN